MRNRGYPASVTLFTRVVGVRGAFTIDTETGEMTCILHLLILGTTPMS